MENFFKKPKEKIMGLKDLERETLIYRVMPKLALEIMRKYFRLQVEGTDHVPRRGPALIVPNHSGYSGFDAIILSHEIHRACRRIPRVLTHHFWFLHEMTAVPASKVGFIEANMQNGISHLQKNNLVILFPEGEQGNFKASVKRYRLQEFKRGFVRMALRTQCPIIPTLVVGAEETHINLSQLKFTKFLRGAVLPLPLNILPLPAKWRIRFLPAIHLPYGPEAADDAELVNEIASEIQESMQQALNQEVTLRGPAFF